MKKLVYKHRSPVDPYPADTNRMMRVLLGKGYSVSRGDVIRAWKEFSEGYSATWAELPEYDSQLLKDLLDVLKEEPQ